MTAQYYTSLPIFAQLVIDNFTDPFLMFHLSSEDNRCSQDQISWIRHFVNRTFIEFDINANKLYHNFSKFLFFFSFFF